MLKRGIYLLFMIFLLTGCTNITVLNPRSTTGKEQADLIWLSLGIMSLVIVVVFVLFTIFVVKYRYTHEKKDTIPKDVKGNKKLELTYTIIPCILLLILAVPTVKVTLDQSPSTEAAKEDGVHINVTARQFQWEFEHENGKAAKDELIMPEGEPIIFHLKSEDVIHSFWIPELAGKVDVFPHKELIYIIRDMEKGTYDGKCAEFCGIQHANMRFNVKVVSEDEYNDYLEE